MCNVCDANMLLEAAQGGRSVTFWWSGQSEFALEVEAQGEAAEFSPAKLRIRRRWGEDLKSASDWSDPFSTEDLAGTLGRLGTDTRWEYVAPDVRNWLAGLGPPPNL